MTQSTFEIRESRGNKTGSLPGHFDIHLAGQDDSMVTVWDSAEMAEFIALALEHRTAIESLVAGTAVGNE